MHAVSSSVISSRDLITRARCISCCPSTTSMPSRWSANRTTGSTTSTPSGSPSSPRSSSERRIFAATSSARPDCGDIAPRIVEMPAGERPSSQGQYISWWRAAEPKSHITGSSPWGSRQKRASLSIAHVPMWVAVM